MTSQNVLRLRGLVKSRHDELYEFVGFMRIREGGRKGERGKRETVRRRHTEGQTHTCTHTPICTYTYRVRQ